MDGNFYKTRKKKAKTKNKSSIGICVVAFGAITDQSRTRDTG